MALGERIKEVRGHLSQAEFAAMLGVSQPTVGKYEKGARLPDTNFIYAVCSRFGVSADWLVLGETFNKNEETLVPAQVEREQAAGDCQRCLDLSKLVQAQEREIILLKENAELLAKNKELSARISFSARAGDDKVQAVTA